MTTQPTSGINDAGDPSLAVRPSIFDACAAPDALLPLVLANLLSPHLWDLAARVRERAASAAPADDGLPPFLRAAQAEIDRHFEHLTPRRTAELFGELDLDEESGRLGSDVVAHALSRIVSGLRGRCARGEIDAAAVAQVEAMVARRRFPAYHYATFDVVRASGRLQRRHHAPWGLTSCLDEVAIFAALAMTQPAGELPIFVALASPEHYTAFGGDHDGNAWWLYGKDRLLSAASWRELVDREDGGDRQRAFDRRLGQFDRIITPDGTFSLGTGESAIPDHRLATIVALLDRFFGCRLAQPRAALARPLRMELPSPLAPLFDELAGGSLAAVRARLLPPAPPAADSPIGRVLLAHRSIAVADLAPYLAAARRSPSCRSLAATLSSIDDAVAAVRTVPGRDSIFGDRERLAMPEETLHFRTGSDRDLALLLHVLLEAMPAAARPRGAVETRLCTDDSYVLAPGLCVSLRTFAPGSPNADALAGGRLLGGP